MCASLSQVIFIADFTPFETRKIDRLLRDLAPKFKPILVFHPKYRNNQLSEERSDFQLLFMDDLDQIFAKSYSVYCHSSIVTLIDFSIAINESVHYFFPHWQGKISLDSGEKWSLSIPLDLQLQLIDMDDTYKILRVRLEILLKIQGIHEQVRI